MTYRTLLSVGLGAALALGASACHPDDITDINNNPNDPTSAPAPTLFTNATRSAVSRWLGTIDVRGFELVAQHLAEVQYPESDQYKRLQGSFTAGLFDGTYSLELEDFQQVINQGIAADEPGYYAPAMVMQTWTFGMLTDTWGDIPYSEALKGDSAGVEGVLTPAYDSQQSIINDFFVKLNTATTDLETAKSDAFALDLDGGDPIYNGDFESWQRFSNSLRARYAMRIVDVDGATADAQLTAAFNAPGGVFTSNAEAAVFPWPGDGVYNNPWSVNFETRDDHRISTRLQGVLQDLSDPRITVFAQLPDKDTTETAEVDLWCRAGAPPCYTALENALEHAVASPYVPYTSRPSVLFYPAATTYSSISGSGASYPSYVMTYAEVAFIQAEAAERGLGGLTPAQAAGFYNAGITASMNQWGVSSAATAAYLANPAVTYQGGAAGLKQIAVQKWIALYSDGAQAWAEYRRTCEPIRLHTGPAAIINTIPQRFEYSNTEYAVNVESLNAAIAAQGEDDFTTPVWWETNRAAAPTFILEGAAACDLQ